MKKRSPKAGLHLAVLSAFAFGALGAAAASAANVRVPFTDTGEPGVRMLGGLDRFEAGVPIPGRWSQVTGSVRLTWNGSPELVSGSQIRVSVAGRILGVRNVSPGAGSATFRIPAQRLSAATRNVPVVVESRLRVRDASCPGPDHLGAYLQFQPSSAVVLTPTWSSAKLTARDLPGALVTGAGRDPSPLLVKFERTPTGASIRAAAVAAGEIAAASPTGVRLRVSTPADPESRRSGEAAVVVEEAKTDAVLRIESRGTHAPAVRILGRGDELVHAAGALRPAVARSAGDATVIRKPPAVTVRRRDLPRRLKLPSARFEGYGSGNASSSFQIPVYLEALRVSRLRLGVMYDAPRGGRATVLINGREIAGETLRENGRSRFDVEEELAPRGPALNRADLQPGNNEVTVSASLNVPREHCSFPEKLGSVATTDFGSVTLQTRERPTVRTLATFPFPMNKKPGWEGSSVQLPASPTVAEVRTIIGVLAEVRRISGEPAMPTVQIGGDVPAGPALVLARPGAVPEELSKGLYGPAEDGVLASSATSDGSVRFLAIGTGALRPVLRDYWYGKVQGRVAQVVSTGDVVTRLDDAERVTGVQRGPVPWRWPLIILAISGLGLFVLLVRGAARRIRGAG